VASVSAVPTPAGAFARLPFLGELPTSRYLNKATLIGNLGADPRFAPPRVALPLSSHPLQVVPAPDSEAKVDTVERSGVE
jgi:hypothetical protein